jgi:hypothetical protein
MNYIKGQKCCNYKNKCLFWSSSVSVNSCKSESIKLLQEALTILIPMVKTAVLVGQVLVTKIN